MAKLIILLAVLTSLGACVEGSGNYNPPTSGGWSGGESLEESQERSGTRNPGATIGPEGVSDSGNGVGFGSKSG